MAAPPVVADVRQGAVAETTRSARLPRAAVPMRGAPGRVTTGGSGAAGATTGGTSTPGATTGGARAGALAVPSSGTTSGLLAALLLTVSAPERGPGAVGTKRTPRSHEPPGATAAVQPLPATWKSPAVVTPATVRSAVPVLTTVTVCGALALPTGWAAKLRPAWLSDAAGAGAGTPVPVRSTDCGAAAPSSCTCSTAVRVPSTVGRKVTVSVQLPAGGRMPTQGVPGLVVKSGSPVTSTPESVSRPGPLFSTVTSAVTGAPPRSAAPRSRAEAGDRVTVGVEVGPHGDGSSGPTPPGVAAPSPKRRNGRCQKS